MPSVVDASVAAAWFSADEDDPLAERAMAAVLSEGGVVPGIWHLELANAFVMMERRKRLSRKDAKRAFADLAALNLEIDSETQLRAFTDIHDLATAHKLTIYDAAYLELALRRGLPLATLDAELRRAAKRAGAQLLV